MFIYIPRAGKPTLLLNQAGAAIASVAGYLHHYQLLQPDRPHIRMTKYIISMITAMLFSAYCYAGVIPNEMYDSVIKLAMNNFWGQARVSDGSYVQPDSEKERMTLPITEENAARVIVAGEISSLANWCGLDWKQNYFKVTKAARHNGLSDKQVAFVGLLHGVTMGMVETAVEGKKCTPDIQEAIEGRLNSTSNEAD